MTLSPKLGLWLTTLLWVCVVGWLWGTHQYQVMHGREIVLKTVPVDPRDLFRGDYVVLRYEISTLNLSRLGQSQRVFIKNTSVFVSLSKTNGYWQATKLDTEPPQQDVFLRGRVTRSSKQIVEVEYGIESYFVPEGQGREIEKKYAQGNLAVVVSVSPHGRGLLKGLRFLQE